jgi:hypothetical protein
MDAVESELLRIVQTFEQCETFITNSLIVPLGEASYLEAGTFGSTPFSIRPAVAKKLKKEGFVLQDRYTLLEYGQLLTSYIIKNKCVDTVGTITPTPFLCSLFKLSGTPCSYFALLEHATRVFL